MAVGPWVQLPDEQRPATVDRLPTVVVFESGARSVSLPSPPSWWSYPPPNTPISGADVDQDFYRAGWATSAYVGFDGGGQFHATERPGGNFDYLTRYYARVAGWRFTENNTLPPVSVPPGATIEWEHPAGSSSDPMVQWRLGIGVASDPRGTVRVHQVPASWHPNWDTVEPGASSWVTPSVLNAWDHTQWYPGPSAPAASGVVPLTTGPVFRAVLMNGLGGGFTAEGSDQAMYALLNPLVTVTYTPPRYRIVTQGGMWLLRQRQSGPGADSWPLRQRQNRGASGSWGLRQRQRGV